MLMKNYSNGMGRSPLVSTDENDNDRLRFERRQKEYRYLANEQIKAILTAMSISHPRKSSLNHTSVLRHATESFHEPSEDQVTMTSASLTIAEERDESKIFIDAFMEGVKKLQLYNSNESISNESSINDAQREVETIDSNKSLLPPDTDRSLLVDEPRRPKTIAL